MSSIFIPKIRIFSKFNKCNLLITKNNTRFHYRQITAEGNSKFAKIWNKLFGKYLLTTNTISAGILLMTGDIISQEIDYRKGQLTKRYDWSRAGRMFVVGCIQGPLHHFFYNWIEKLLPVKTMKTTIYKIFLDQTLMSPLIIVMFFYPACLLEQKSLAESNTEFLTKFGLAYAIDWCIWPAAQFINFQYVQPKYRVIYVNFVTVIFDIFLSSIKHNDIE